MKSVLRIGMLCAAFAAVVVLSASPVSAQGRGQRGGGQRGGFGGGFGGQQTTSRLQLASLSEVQAALKLTDEQKKVAKEVLDKLNADRAELRPGGGGGGGNFGAFQEQIAKLNSEAEAKLAEKLDDAQKKRLTEIFVQVNGTAALADKEVQKALGLNEETVKKLDEVRTANREATMAALRELGQDATPEQRREKTQSLRKEADEKLLAVLSADQKAAFEKLGGEKVEIDLSQLRPQQQRRQRNN